MFALVIERFGEPPRRKVFGRERNLSVGRGADNDIVLDDPKLEATGRALIIVEKDRLMISTMDLSKVRVGYLPVRDEPVEFTACRVGAYTLRVAEHRPVRSRPPTLERTEEELLAAIATGDEQSRLVYADWLEQRGDPVRAEFLRVQHALGSLGADDPKFPPATDRLRELGSQVDILWRARVARPAIEGCEGFDFQCPKEWGSLQPTDREKVRFCGACKSEVFYSASIAEARRYASDGKCVALDLGAARWADDLAGPFGRHTCPDCKLDVGPTVRRCPRCASRVRTEMLRGRMVVTPRR